MRYRRAWIAGGTYFFTLALANRRSRLLVDHIDILREAVRRVRVRHAFAVDAMVVLPDHLHAVWTLPKGDADYPMRWRRIKAVFAAQVPAIDTRSPSQLRRGERGIWQHRYWEHLIRDEIDLLRHLDYIHYNPVKHGHVDRPADWPYSSIHRFIRDGVLHPDWATGPDDEWETGE